MARIHDLQCRYSDITLTKKDCDMICKALENTYTFKEIKNLYWYFKNLTYIRKVIYY